MVFVNDPMVSDLKEDEGDGERGEMPTKTGKEKRWVIPR